MPRPTLPAAALALAGGLAGAMPAGARPASAAVGVVAGGVARVSASCPGGAHGPTGRAWPAPLDRVVTVHAEEVRLGVALERLAGATGVRLSYSPDLVPLERVVCLPGERRALGDLLVAVLAGTRLEPVVAGTQRVLIVPTHAAATPDTLPPRTRPVRQLDRIIVTGSAMGAPERGSPFALSVIDGAALSPDGPHSIADVVNATVPGLWVWPQSPLSPVVRYGSIRGASSLGVTAPKVYIDGIEVANALMLRDLDPSDVQRMEIIRGPQGAALYGADAISGVVNIVTRHDGAGAGGRRTELRTSAGTVSSAFAERGVIAQEHSAQVRTGTAMRSADGGVSVSTLGPFIAGASTRHVQLHAGARRVGARMVLAGSARFDADDATVPTSPLVAGVVASSAAAGAALADTAGRQRMRQYTVGTSATIRTSSRWTSVVAAGLDGYQLGGLSAEGMLVPSPTDSALRVARGRADRGTLRLNTTGVFGAPERQALTVSVGAEQTTARETTAGVQTQEARGNPSTRPPTVTLVPSDGPVWWSNTGVLAQGQLALRNALFLTGGARAEYIDGPANGPQIAWLPMVGGAWVWERDARAVKLHAAYGRGIRPAHTMARDATWTGASAHAALTFLTPEEQSGTEAGVDLLLGAGIGLHATRFDQRASGLVQPVAMLADSTVSGSRGRGIGVLRRRIAYELQNVGAIDNRGWELQASSVVGPVTLAGTLSLVDSRVHRLASGYSGDLTAGDRVLEVPARTYGLNAAWSRGRWSASASLARAADWINYDRLAIAATLLSTDGSTSSQPGKPDKPGKPANPGKPATPATPATPTTTPSGAQLREYWRTYDGVTRIDGRLSMAVWRDAAISLTAGNLLDRQLGEPDDVTVLPGRSLTLGLRAAF